MSDAEDLARRRIAIALSGGVDSAVTASILQQQGADVFGITMLMQDSDDGKDAAAVAAELGIAHHIIDARARFKTCVMNEFADSYLRGETPNPCVFCNKNLKFGDLIDAAKGQGADMLATGHYARRVDGPNGAELHQAVDPVRDQSYFLCMLSQEQISYVLFPLGAYSKDEVRNLARDVGLYVADKKDSQDICFVPDGDYVSVLETLRPAACKAGDIVDQAGHVLGRHKGIIHYTVGQRKGLDISNRTGENNEPLYVVRIDAAREEVVVGPRQALACTEVMLKDMNWLGGDVPDDGLCVSACLRSTMRPVPARFYMKNIPESGQGRLVLDEPIYGISAGQAGVIYDGTRVLGGGWIVGDQ